MTADAALAWTGPAWDAWCARLAEGRRPPVLLLHGPPGVGKAQLAARMAAGVLCHAPTGPGVACGRCAGCQQHAAGSHPDALGLRPDPEQPGALAHYPVQACQLEKGRSARFVSVDQARELIDHLTRAPRPGGTRLAVVWPADALNENAANALLKILEEPPENAATILIAHRPALLPATVRSRCQAVAVALPDPHQADAWLTAFVPDGERRALALRLAGGAPLLARELAGEDPQALWRAVAGGAQSVLRGADPVAVASAWQRFAPERVELALYAWLRAQLRPGTGALESVQGSGGRTLLPLIALLDELETLRRAARIALARPLAWEGLLVRLAEAA